MPRTAGKRGKLPAQHLPLRPIGAYLAAPLPAPVYPVDVTGGIAPGAWQMLGNDKYGNCTFCGRQHVRMAKAACLGETETWETAAQLVAEYLAYDHGQDTGAVISSLLMSWYQAGIILGFAPVDHTDRAQCDAAMARFNGLYLGGDLTDDADQLFGNAEPWTVENGEQPDPQEGHCFARVRSTGAGPDAMSGNVTWGALQESTAAWDAACITEAYVLVTSEDQMRPEELAALRADIDALGGTGGGTPANGSLTAPALLAEIARLVREVAAAPERTIAEVVAWLHGHGL